MHGLLRVEKHGQTSIRCQNSLKTFYVTLENNLFLLKNKKLAGYIFCRCQCLLFLYVTFLQNWQTLEKSFFSAYMIKARGKEK